MMQPESCLLAIYHGVCESVCITIVHLSTCREVGTGLVGAPACGDVMKLQIFVDENGKIADAKFKTFGCGSAIASSSLATEKIKGLTVRLPHICTSVCK